MFIAIFFLLIQSSLVFFLTFFFNSFLRFSIKTKANLCGSKELHFIVDFDISLMALALREKVFLFKFEVRVSKEARKLEVFEFPKLKYTF